MSMYQPIQRIDVLTPSDGNTPVKSVVKVYLPFGEYIGPIEKYYIGSTGAIIVLNIKGTPEEPGAEIHKNVEILSFKGPKQPNYTVTAMVYEGGSKKGEVTTISQSQEIPEE